MNDNSTILNIKNQKSSSRIPKIPMIKDDFKYLCQKGLNVSESNNNQQSMNSNSHYTTINNYFSVQSPDEQLLEANNLQSWYF